MRASSRASSARSPSPREKEPRQPFAATAETAETAPASRLSGRELREAEKEMAALERRIERLHARAAEAKVALADLDQSDYQRLGAEMAAITALEDEAAALEERWLELGERV